MKATFISKSALKHTVQVHDGEMVGKGVVKGIFKDMAASAIEKHAMAGTAMPGASSSSKGPAEPERAAASGAAGSASAASAAEPEEDSEDDESIDPMDLITGGGKAKRGSAEKANPKTRASSGGSAGNGAHAARQPAEAKGKAKPLSSAPPPLVKGAGAGGATRRAKSGAADATMGGDRAERDASLQLTKLEKLTDEWTRMQRGSILQLDKKYFKSTKAITDSLSSKMRALSKSLQAKATMSTKLIDCYIRITKAYKLWARKNTASEFLGELADVEKFASQHPPVAMVFPECIQQAILQMRFSFDLIQVVSKNDTSTILERFKMISKEHLVQFFQSEELVEWQKDWQTYKIHCSFTVDLAVEARRCACFRACARVCVCVRVCVCLGLFVCLERVRERACASPCLYVLMCSVPPDAQACACVFLCLC